MVLKLRLLLLARRRQRPRSQPASESRFRSLQEWEDHFRDAIEGVDQSFDNGGAAFAAVVNVSSYADLDELLGAYPWRVWIDAETRELPETSETERERWRELALEKSECLRQIRAQGDHRYASNIKLLHPLLQQADSVDPNHPFVAGLLAYLRHDYGDAFRYAEQEVVARRLLTLHERLVGPNDPSLIVDCLALAFCLYLQDRPTARTPKNREAELLFRRALRIAESEVPVDTESVRDCVHQLGQYYLNIRRYRLAEPLLLRLVDLDERRAEMAGQASADTLGPKALERAILIMISDLATLRRLYEQRGRFSEAERIVRRQEALSAGPELSMPDLKRSMRIRTTLADLIVKQGRYEEAAAMYRDAVRELDEFWVCSPDERREEPYTVSRWNRDHSIVQSRAHNLDRLASVLARLELLDEARTSYQEAVETIERFKDIVPPPKAGLFPFPSMTSQVALDGTLASILKRYASLLRKLGRRAEAADLSRKSRAIAASAEERRQAILEARRAQVLAEQ